MLQTSLSVIYVVLLVALTSFTDVKLGPVQISEVASLLGLSVIAPILLLRVRFPTVRSEQIGVVAIFMFFVAVICSAVVAYIRGDFFPPRDAGTLLRQPGWISAARVFQLFLVFSSFSAIVYAARRDPAILARCVRIYIYGLTLSSLYGIGSFVVMVGTGIEIGGAYGESSVRLRAFFVEGGPFGLFAASGLLMLVAQWQRRYMRRQTALICGAIIGTALLLAQSKASVLAMVVAMALATLFTGIRFKRSYIIPAALVMALIITAASFSNLNHAISALGQDREALLLAPEGFGDDMNIAAGRVAGSIIVPNMIAAHPFMGVGIGNYSLTRNAPEYNRVLPTLDMWDLHGLGLYGFLAEIGAVAFFFFICFLLAPALSAKRVRAPFSVVVLCCFPFIAFLFGVQPTFLYPWVVCALGIAMVRDFAENKQ